MTKTHLMNVYNRFDVTFTHGKGLYLYDDKGTEYIDMGAGIAVNAFGHCHPDIVHALEQQSKTLWHISNLYTSKPQLECADFLCAHSFADVVFFANSGAEAVECALKTARRYFHHIGKSDKTEIITFTGAFHGRTHLCIAATGTKTSDGYGHIPEDFKQVPYHDITALKKAITPKTAAILVEPIQGEGGIIAASSEYLRAVRALCDEHDILMIADEIQCGMGRTGKLFAFEYADIQPDICTSAKGIGGGFPIGACLATHKAASGMIHGTHGSTYGGNPLGCAVALQVLNMLHQDGFMQQVQENGAYLHNKLEELQERYGHIIHKVHGKGLMLGLVFNKDFAPRSIAEQLLTKGLIVIPASNNVIRFLPPLIISKDQCDSVHGILNDFLRNIS